MGQFCLPNAHSAWVTSMETMDCYTISTRSTARHGILSEQQRRALHPQYRKSRIRLRQQGEKKTTDERTCLEIDQQDTPMVTPLQSSILNEDPESHIFEFIRLHDVGRVGLDESSKSASASEKFFWSSSLCIVGVGANSVIGVLFLLLGLDSRPTSRCPCHPDPIVAISQHRSIKWSLTARVLKENFHTSEGGM